jgi:multidrug transporter EmrE-like cation transporter
MHNAGVIVGAIVCNVMAQIALKQAGRLEGNYSNVFLDMIAKIIDPWVLTGLMSYSVSFILTTAAYKNNALSIISPVMAGAIISLTVVMAFVLFGEPVGLCRVSGIALILVGILLVSA